MKGRTQNIVASVLARLRKQAAAEGTPFNQALQFYAMERFLWRLSRSPHAEGVLLKGALLLKTIGLPRARPTMDIDLLRRGKADRDSLLNLVRECALIEDENDGMTFDATSVTAEDIAKEAEYQGTRVLLSGRMDNVRLRVQIDFGVGDVVASGPRWIEYPTYLDQKPLRVLAYPIESAIAEKFQAMVALDLANSRMKDFFDVWNCSRNLSFEGETLASAMEATFTRRATPIPLEAPAAFTADFYEASAHQTQWRAFVRKIGQPELKDRFASIVDDIASFLMPPSRAVASGEKFRLHWTAQGGWTAP